jgi:hypothetical protein
MRDAFVLEQREKGRAAGHAIHVCPPIPAIAGSGLACILTGNSRCGSGGASWLRCGPYVFA